MIDDPHREFWWAIHSLWLCQRSLGLAVSSHRPVEVISSIDAEMAKAMAWVERVDDRIMAARSKT